MHFLGETSGSSIFSRIHRRAAENADFSQSFLTTSATTWRSRRLCGEHNAAVSTRSDLGNTPVSPHEANLPRRIKVGSLVPMVVKQVFEHWLSADVNLIKYYQSLTPLIDG